MRTRDKLYKELALEKYPNIKNEISANYKRYRNEVVNLIRISKRDYYKNYFEEHRSNMKKTWDGIRSIINVTKKV